MEKTARGGAPEVGDASYASVEELLDLLERGLLSDELVDHLRTVFLARNVLARMGWLE